LLVQSNLCTMTTLGTQNYWPLLTGGRRSFMLKKITLGPEDSGRCWLVVAIRRWSLTQVWLYMYTNSHLSNSQDRRTIVWLRTTVIGQRKFLNAQKKRVEGSVNFSHTDPLDCQTYKRNCHAVPDWTNTALEIFFITKTATN